MKKLLIALAVMLLLATLALGLAARLGGPRLLAHAIRSVGAGLGYQEIEVTVSEVGLRRTVLAAISAGPAPGLRASDVTLEYGPRSLFLEDRQVSTAYLLLEPDQPADVTWVVDVPRRGEIPVRVTPGIDPRDYSSTLRGC